MPKPVKALAMGEKVRKKICHFSSVHHQTDTRVFFRECVWLSNDFDVTLIAIGEFSGVKNGVNIIGIPKPANRLKRLLHTTRKVYKLAKKQKADLYHFHDPELIPFAWLLSLQGKKVIYDIHENVAESLKDKAWLPFKKLFIFLYLLIEKMFIGRFELVLAEQAYVKIYKQRFVNKSLHLVRNFSSNTLLKPFCKTDRVVKNNSVTIFYMGSIDQLYAYKPMLESIAVLNKHGFDARLKLIGWYSNDTLKEIQNLSFWQTIKDKIYMPGFMEITEGYKHSTNCNIAYSFVSDNLNVAQSFPRKMYEYMHIGLPVVTSGHLLYKQMVETHAIGLSVEHNTAVEIAKAVTQLIQSGEYLNTMAQNNVDAANKYFNWEDEYQTLKKLYLQLIG